MVVTVQNAPKWLLSQLGQLVIAVALISLVFNYGYRFLVDWSINSPGFYAVTIVLALVTFFIVRRDYIFVNRYDFAPDEMTVRTLLGVRKSYATARYEFVPSLHKTISWPENKASLSFHIREKASGKDIRNYSWSGFSAEEFSAVSRFYGYSGETDFRQKDFGKR